jgi:hypothetical protein
MNSFQMISNIVGGFASGFASSRLYNAASSIEDKIREVEILAGKEQAKEMLQAGGVDSNLLKKVDKIKTKAKLSAATFGSCVASLTYLLQNHGPATLVENLWLSLPFTYLGFVSGMTYDNIKNRAYRQDLKTAERLQQDPSTIEAFLSDDQRTNVKSSLEQIQTLISNGDKFEPEDENGPVKKIHDTLSGQRFYNKVLLQWGLVQIKEAAEKAKFQYEIKEFFEATPPCPHALGCYLVGDFKGTNGVLYKRQGDQFFIQDFDLESIKMTERDSGPAKVVVAEVPKAKYNSINQTTWNPDYRSLSNDIREIKESKTCVLMQSPVGFPAHMEDMVLTEVVAGRFIAQQMAERHSRGEGR